MAPVVTMVQVSSTSPSADSQRSYRPPKAEQRRRPSSRCASAACATCAPVPTRHPLVEAVGGQQAAMAAIRHPERRLVGDRLAARVDHLGADRGVLRPARHEAPAHAHEFALPVGADAHDGHVGRRRDVVARACTSGGCASPKAARSLPDGCAIHSGRTSSGPPPGGLPRRVSGARGRRHRAGGARTSPPAACPSTRRRRRPPRRRAAPSGLPPSPPLAA